MRLDYALYVVAALFFILTVISAIIIVETERSLWVVTTVVLGMLSIGLGYYQRPRATSSTQVTAPPASAPAEPLPPATQTKPVQASAEVKIEEKIEAPVQSAPAIESPPIIEAPAQPQITETPTPAIIESPPAPQAPTPEVEATPIEPVVESPLTRVKGIGEKRATQLKALGINSLDDLAKASAQDVAKSLKISPKIVDKWILGAKDLVK